MTCEERDAAVRHPPAAPIQEATRAAQPFTRPTSSGVVFMAISPRNGYYTKDNIAAGLRYILDTMAEGWTLRPFVPQGPSVWTYRALGYTDAAAESSARRQARHMRRLARKGASGDDRFLDCEWDELVGGEAAGAAYRAAIDRLDAAHESSASFRHDVQNLTRAVLERRGGASDAASRLASRYLIEEFACVSILREVLGVERVVMVYHKPMQIVDRLLKGTPYGLPGLEGVLEGVVNAETDEAVKAYADPKPKDAMAQ